jgi:hypothetical protein
LIGLQKQEQQRLQRIGLDLLLGTRDRFAIDINLDFIGNLCSARQKREDLLACLDTVCQVPGVDLVDEGTVQMVDSPGEGSSWFRGERCALGSCGSGCFGWHDGNWFGVDLGDGIPRVQGDMKRWQQPEQPELTSTITSLQFLRVLLSWP